jgi:hypothetical protein
MTFPDKFRFPAATLLSMLLCAAPLLAVDWLPMIDLPNHLAQAHLVGKVLSGNQPDMQINWLAPDTLTTWVLAALLLVLPPLLAAKTLVLGLVMLTILGIALLARNIGASASVVPLSAAMLFNQSFYWGFLPFVAGFAACLFLLLAWLRLERVSWRATGLLAALFLLVYACHILWLVVALAAALLVALAAPERGVKLRVLVAAALPALVLTLSWYPSMHHGWMDAGFDMAAYWGIPLAGRLAPDYAAAAIGGLRSNFNLAVLAAALAFAAAGIARSAGKRQRIPSAPLLAVAALLLAGYLALPDKYSNTVLFSVRWLPYALILLLLGCLAPLRAAGWRSATLLCALAMLAGYALLTAGAWRGMEQEELSGLTQAMQQLPPRQSVLGLDFIRTSGRVNTPVPFATIAAYAQALKDDEVNFSFAEQASSLVTYRTIPVRPYRRRLNLISQAVSRADLAYFNYVLVNADAAEHDRLAGLLGMTPVTHQGRWRLYAVVHAD